MKTFDEIREWINDNKLPSTLDGFNLDIPGSYGCPEIGGSNEAGWVGWIYRGGEYEDECYVGPFATEEEAEAALLTAVAPIRVGTF